MTLLPCPFCASPDVVATTDEDWPCADVWFVYCQVCHMQGPIRELTRHESNTQEEAEKLWNARGNAREVLGEFEKKKD